MRREEISENANILGDRSELVRKHEGAKTKVWKARFVVRVYQDIMKTSLVLDSVTIQQKPTKISADMTAIICFQIFSADVT